MVTQKLLLRSTLVLSLLVSAEPVRAQAASLPYVARMEPPPGYTATSHPRYGWLVAGGAILALGYYGHVRSDDPNGVRFIPVAGPLVDRYWGFAFLQALGAGLGTWSIVSPHREFSRNSRASSLQLRPLFAGRQDAMLELSGGF